MSDPIQPTKKPRSGTETRRLKATLPRVRCTEAQRAAVELAADRANLTLSAYMLAVLVNQQPARAAPVSRIDRDLLAQMLGEIGHIGGNINQIAKALNQHHAPNAAALQALPDIVADISAAIMEALGKRPSSDAPEDGAPDGIETAA